MTNPKNKLETAAIRCASITANDLNEKQVVALAKVMNALSSDFDKVEGIVITRTTLPYEHREYVTVTLKLYKSTCVVNDRHHRLTFNIGKRGGLFVWGGSGVRRMAASGVRRLAEAV